MKKILISACFLGEKVRYDGKHQKLTDHIIKKWQTEGRLISACPECLGGLPVPRDPAEIQLDLHRVITVQSEDVTSQFMKGAQKTLTICLNENIKFALLKESSPSCGSTTVYDGTFSNNKVEGKGITAKLLHDHGIHVFSENSIEALISTVNGDEGIT